MKLAHIQTEIDASYLYSQLAAHEEDQIIAQVYKEMSDIEKSHAVLFGLMAAAITFGIGKLIGISVG